MPVGICHTAMGCLPGSPIVVAWHVRLSRAVLGEIGNELLVITVMSEMCGAHWRQLESCRKTGEKCGILLHVGSEWPHHALLMRHQATAPLITHTYQALCWTKLEHYSPLPCPVGLVIAYLL